MQNTYFDIVLIETPVDTGLTRSQVIDIIDMIGEDEFLPITINNPNMASDATGFIAYSVADLLNFDYSSIEEYMQPILEDVTKESESNAYTYSYANQDISIFLSR